MIELVIGLGFISVFWIIIQMIFISQNMNNFFGALIFSVLHIFSYIGFLISFTSIEFDLVMFIYSILIFLLHALIHIIGLNFNTNTSHIIWIFGFIVLDIIVLVFWYYAFFLKIL